jgi:hypothetical protein
MRKIAPLLLSATVLLCAAPATSQPRSPKAEMQLQQWLGGKVAGQPIDCMTAFRPSDMVVIDDNTILFKGHHNVVYRNDPPGGCSPMSLGGYALVTRSTTNRLCRGEIAQVVDLRTGVINGGCAMGSFVPYHSATR